jgi:hypothetical protein
MHKKGRKSKPQPLDQARQFAASARPLLLDGVGGLPVRRALALAALKSASSVSTASSAPPVMGKLPTSALVRDSLPRRRSILVSHLTLEFASEQLVYLSGLPWLKMFG